MLKEFQNTSYKSRLVLADQQENMLDPRNRSGLFKFIFGSEKGVELCVDSMVFQLNENQVICLTPLQQVQYESGKYLALLFNREFYCIHENDHEVSCEGLLFFGSSELPVLTLNAEEQKKFDDLLNVFEDEMDTRDEIQGEMLRMLLKRLIIKCTRLAKSQLLAEGVADHHVEIIRKYNILVEKHFRDKHKVSDYAKLLNKSPKTLSNIFLSYNHHSPLEVIHNRIALEGKRLLLNTDKISKEIAYELGFEDQSHFSRFFKKETGVSPSSFRKEHQSLQSGKN